MRLLVIGASGMLGSTVLRVLSETPGVEVRGSVRDLSVREYFSPDVAGRLIGGIDVENLDSLVGLMAEVRPDVVINCVGLTKHKADAEDPVFAVPINTLMPHRLAKLCEVGGARLVHISTDCVFSGAKGSYVEDDLSDASDVYGKSKAMGELAYPNTITLRTSIIGHELRTKYGLLEWFLSQEGGCGGFTRAVFSGLPTVVLAHVIRDVVVPHHELFGVYHVAAEPICKYDLLKLVARVYDKSIDIAEDDRLVIDRSLDASRFRAATGFVAPSWEEMIKTMHRHR
jgi:dTDP-4-dehydrorhamnose reductase